MPSKRVLKDLNLDYVLEVLGRMSKETVDGAVTSNELAVRIQGDNEDMDKYDVAFIRRAVVEVKIVFMIFLFFRLKVKCSHFSCCEMDKIKVDVTCLDQTRTNGDQEE